MRRLLAWVVLFCLVGAGVVEGGVKNEAKPVQHASAEVQRLTAGNNRFALDLYARLAAEKKSGGNLFFSPYSLSVALGMTHAGAKGETADQIARTLHFDQRGEELDAAFASLIGSVNRPAAQGYKLSVANAMWGQGGYGFLPEYVRRLQQHYAAGLR